MNLSRANSILVLDLLHLVVIFQDDKHETVTLIALIIFVRRLIQPSKLTSSFIHKH